MTLPRAVEDIERQTAQAVANLRRYVDEQTPMLEGLQRTLKAMRFEADEIERTAKQACDALRRMLEGEVAHG